MQKSAGLDDAIVIAAQAHQKQKDKSDAPYILHPLRLMMYMQTETEKIAAVLHDVVEDSDLTIEQLREKGFPPDVLNAVECLTHRNGEDYETYIERVKTNETARKVKIADLEDNMNLQRIARELTEKDFKRIEKYHRIWRELKSQETSNSNDQNVVKYDLSQPK